MNNGAERFQNWPRMYLALVFCMLLFVFSTTNLYADSQSINDESYPLGTIQNPINLLMVVYNSPMLPWTQAMQNGFIKGVNETDLVVNVFTESIYASITAGEKLSLDLSTLFTGKYQHIKFHGMYTESTDAKKHSVHSGQTTR